MSLGVPSSGWPGPKRSRAPLISAQPSPIKWRARPTPRRSFTIRSVADDQWLVASELRSCADQQNATQTLGNRTISEKLQVISGLIFECSPLSVSLHSSPKTARLSDSSDSWANRQWFRRIEESDSGQTLGGKSQTLRFARATSSLNPALPTTPVARFPLAPPPLK
jgi:hypothetical protein